MEAKRNKTVVLNSFWSILVLLITFSTMMSSCVEGDLYDLYDEDFDINDLTVRKKTTKDVFGEASPEQCGFCCMAYIRFGNVDSQSISKVYQFAKEAGVTNGVINNNALTSSDIAAACNGNVGSISTWIGINWIINGSSYTDRSYLINILNTTSTIPVIIQKEPNHWVVGTHIDKNAQTVSYVDPKYTNSGGSNLSGIVPFSQIDCLIY